MSIIALLRKPVADKKVLVELEQIKKNLLEKNKKKNEENEEEK